MKLLKNAGMAMLCAMMAFGFAGCTSSSTDDGKTDVADQKSAMEVMDEIWDKNADPNKPDIVGGLGEDAVEGMPQAFDISDTKGIQEAYGVPQNIGDEALNGAGMVNAMMANNFTASLLEMNNGTDMKAAADATVKSLQQQQWVCGQPEQFVVAYSGNYLFTEFGLKETTDHFLDAAKEVLPDLVVVAQDPVE